MPDQKDLIKKIKNYNKFLNPETLNKAYNFLKAQEYHYHQLLKLATQGLVIDHVFFVPEVIQNG